MVNQAKAATVMRLQPGIKESVKVFAFTLWTMKIMICRRNIIDKDVNHLLMFIAYCLVPNFQNLSRTKLNPS